VYDGVTIPNLNGNPGGANSPGQATQVQMFLRGGLTSGTGQTDAFQGHKHNAEDIANNLIALFGVTMLTTTAPGTNGGTYLSSVKTSTPITDETNGTPRIGSETRPVNMSVVWIIKVK
jgi:hypothetical protein